MSCQGLLLVLANNSSPICLALALQPPTHLRHDTHCYFNIVLRICKYSTMGCTSWGTPQLPWLRHGFARWTCYLRYVQPEVCSTWDMFYLRYALPEICCTWGMCYLRYVQPEVCSTWDMFYLRYALPEICCTWGMCYLRYVLPEICSTWDMIYLRYILHEACSTWGMCYLRYGLIILEISKMDFEGAQDFNVSSIEYESDVDQESFQFEHGAWKLKWSHLLILWCWICKIFLKILSAKIKLVIIITIIIF